MQNHHRPRIKTPPIGTGIVDDTMSFIPNKCTIKARKIKESDIKINCNFWEDKHYSTRSQHGDDDGVRVGIERAAVMQLIEESMPYLYYLSAVMDHFSFLNTDNTNRKNRIVLQRIDDDLVMLNVVIECYTIDIITHEITIKTAMKINGFELSDGQFALELMEGGAKLRQFQKKRLCEIIYIGE